MLRGRFIRGRKVGGAWLEHTQQGPYLRPATYDIHCGLSGTDCGMLSSDAACRNTCSAEGSHRRPQQSSIASSRLAASSGRAAMRRVCTCHRSPEADANMQMSNRLGGPRFILQVPLCCALQPAPRCSARRRCVLLLQPGHGHCAAARSCSVSMTKNIVYE